MDTTTIRRLRPKRAASNCPLTLYPPRYIERAVVPSALAVAAAGTTTTTTTTTTSSSCALVEICRFHNFDAERGCLRRRLLHSSSSSRSHGCPMDHEHCYTCGRGGHRALECCSSTTTNNNDNDTVGSGLTSSSVVFRFNNDDGDGDPIITIDANASMSMSSAIRTDPTPLSSSSSSSIVTSVDNKNNNNNNNNTTNYSSSSLSLPALLVLGGRLRGRTLAACEMLPLPPSSESTSSSSSSLSSSMMKANDASSSSPLSSSVAGQSSTTTTWMKLPNLREHRGSAAACSPIGTGLAFVLGGGTADGNSDVVEMLNFGTICSSYFDDPFSCGPTKRRRLNDDVEDDDDNDNDDDGCRNGSCSSDLVINHDMDSTVDGRRRTDDHTTTIATTTEWRWQEMESRLSEPRHAFGAVACVSSTTATQTSSSSTTKTDTASTTTTSIATTTTTSTIPKKLSGTLYAVGGWSHGTVSCGRVERLTFEHDPCLNTEKDCVEVGSGDTTTASSSALPLVQSKWKACASLLLPRRLHSVVSSANGSYIYVMGGFIDDRRTTSSIECYDVHADTWVEMEEGLPYGGSRGGCPLVQAVPDGHDGFLIFPFGCGYSGGGGGGGGGMSKEEKRMLKKDGRALVLRYTPETKHATSSSSFSPIPIPTTVDGGYPQLRLPVADWHSFSATSSITLRKAYLVGGTISGKWTNRGYELDLQTYEWRELPPMAFARRRMAALVLE